MTPADPIDDFITRWQRSATTQKSVSLAGLFGRRNKARVERVTELLEMLVLLGQATVNAEGRYAAG